jgi:hypothetical protein
VHTWYAEGTAAAEGKNHGRLDQRPGGGGVNTPFRVSASFSVLTLI